MFAKPEVPTPLPIKVLFTLVPLPILIPFTEISVEKFALVLTNSLVKDPVAPTTPPSACMP